ncbi:MAG TPA: M20/M25/M40 family metallo-hydrolase [Chloroflexota bacterium]|nr:M20/M25/M40 family metallo-hydrolase [Chloroflexota bacterium]
MTDGDSISPCDQLYDDAERATLHLVSIRSVSPSPGERDAAEAVLRLLQADGLKYDAMGIAPLPGDRHGRGNAYVLLLGRSPETVVLTGHLDTVGTRDFGDLEPYALHPDRLAQRMPVPDGWLAGRGIADMKSGVGAMIAVLRCLARRPRSERPLSIIMAATPDEENESAGMLALPALLLRLRADHDLRLVGAINTDVSTPARPDDPYRYVYTGTIGKLLVGYYVVGRAAHAGAPHEGIDANLLAAEIIRDVSLAHDLGETVRNTESPPPVTLHAADLKSEYNTQIPHEASISLNVLTLERTPAEVLGALSRRAETSLARALGSLARARGVRSEGGAVLTYEELFQTAAGAAGEDRVKEVVEGAWESAAGDLRDRSLTVVRRLFSLAALNGPAVVLYLAPPYYPHLPEMRSPLSDALRAAVSAHSADNVQVREFFPLLSDMSYLSLAPDLGLAELIRTMPAWGRREGYSLPVDAIRRLAIPAVNIGPHGEGIHGPAERVLADHAFRVVPRLILETISELSTRVLSPLTPTR